MIKTVLYFFILPVHACALLSERSSHVQIAEIKASREVKDKAHESIFLYSLRS